MTKTLRSLRWLIAFFMVTALSFSTDALAQDIEEVTPIDTEETGFKPYRGRCQGLFYDYGLETLQGDMIGIEYVRTTPTEFIFPNFLRCGLDLTVTLSGNYDDEGYCALHLNMDGAQYDGAGYFYSPFTAGQFKYSIEAPNQLIVGPIHQAYSYYNADYDHMAFLYVGYPHNDFFWIDIKLNTDINESYPRYFIDEDDPYYPVPSGVHSVVAPKSLDGTYYDLSGRNASAGAQGIMIENGRKVIR